MLPLALRVAPTPLEIALQRCLQSRLWLGKLVTGPPRRHYEATQAVLPFRKWRRRKEFMSEMGPQTIKQHRNNTFCTTNLKIKLEI